MTAWLWVGAAMAGGYYHPADLSSESEVFAKASSAMEAPLHERAKAASDLSAALNLFQEGLDLAGDRTPADQRARHEAIKKAYNRDFAKLQAFADAVIEDFDAEFTAAMERALAGKEATECVREVAKGPSMPGLPVRTQKNPACVGDDLNQGIAQQMDADPVLKKAVDEILGVTWPDLDVPVEPAAPIGGPERHVSINVVMRTGAEDALRAIDREDSDARFEFELSIREDASKEELTGYLEAARKVTATTAARRAEAAAGVMSAADAVMAKWADKGEPATGWCLQPAALGGCSGADVTYPLLPRILDDRKVLKAMPD